MKYAENTTSLCLIVGTRDGEPVLPTRVRNIMSDDAKVTGRYENSETHRFWSAKVIGTFVTITFGNIGSSGHRASREFGTPEAAERFVIEQVKSKMAEGFRKAADE